MMGTKARVFAPLPPVSLEDLVPPDHFYRHLAQALDLGFVRDWTRERMPNEADRASIRWDVRTAPIDRPCVSPCRGGTRREDETISGPLD